ncbi:MAG TPA: hypothetical protein VFS29_06730 [Motilibacteraceae bacterium]|nr:hypothetical protein [Motilibacteraceae bacterium]
MLVLWSALLTALVLGPALGTFTGGYVLSYDMVFVPDQPLLAATAGFGTSAPRAVPQDAVVAVLDDLVPGHLVQGLVLTGTLVAAGIGAGRLVPTSRTWVRLAAATLAIWNPFVAERLVLGHWALLLAYALLPWLLRYVRATVVYSPQLLGRNALRCLLLVAACSLTPTGGMLALAVVAVALARRDVAARARAVLLGGTLALQLPWVVAGVVHAVRYGGTSDPAGVAAFAARSDTRLGLPGSLLTLGGVWNADVVPAGRGTLYAAVVAVVGIGVGLAGVRGLRRRDPSLLRDLAVLAAVGLVLALLGVLPPTRAALEWATGAVPGAGLLRDGQKWLALAAPFVCTAWALGLEQLARRFAVRPVVAALAALGLLLPLFALPGLAWGAHDRLRPVRYPQDWARVRSALAASGRPGDVVVLPWAAFRQFAWNGGRTALDPAPRWLPRTTLVADDLPVGQQVVRGEDPRAQRISSLLAGDRPLTEQLAADGVGWVLLEHGTPGPAVPPAHLRGLEPVVDGPDLTLLRVPPSPDR